MEDYVTYEQAKKLKELGFDWECNHYFDTDTKEFIENHNDYSPEDSFSDCSSYDNHNGCWNCISAPTLSQAAKWLREVKDICVTSSIKIHKGEYKFNWNITLFKEDRGVWDESVIYDTYEDALTAGIDRVLEIL